MYIIQPLGSLAIVTWLVIHYRKKGLTIAVFVLAALSYFVAIAAKTIIQDYTLSGVTSTFGYASIETGLYFGLQTSVLEVFGAYLVAYYAQKWIKQRNAGAYGISLAFWENGILLGILPLISLVADYLLIAYGSPSLSSLVSSQLQKLEPGPFSSTATALPLVGYSILERISSLLIHYSWGFLVVSAVSQKKMVYLAMALPMGFVDAIVPFAGTLGLAVTEGIFFAIGLVSILLVTLVAKSISQQRSSQNQE